MPPVIAAAQEDLWCVESAHTGARLRSKRSTSRTTPHWSAALVAVAEDRCVRLHAPPRPPHQSHRLENWGSQAVGWVTAASLPRLSHSKATRPSTWTCRWRQARRSGRRRAPPSRCATPIRWSLSTRRPRTRGSSSR